MRNHMRQILAWLMVLALAAGLLPASAFAAGDPTEITSFEQITDLSGNYLLTQDTTVAAPVTGTFTGTFDGGGHTITVTISTADLDAGMFASIGSGATVKNFKIKDSALAFTGSSDSACTGMVAGQNAGTVSDIVVENSTVSGYATTGGIVGRNSGTVTRCAFESGAVSKGTSPDRGFGGIVGENTGTVMLCSNGAKVDHSSATRNNDFTGGIVGTQSSSTATVSDCYNFGELYDGNITFNKSYYIGGVVGKCSGTAVNCHNYGTIATESGHYRCYGVASGATNSYYLTGCGASEGGTAKTADEFKTLAATLGETNWVDGSDGYPVLEWQTWKYSNTAIKYTVEYYTEGLDGIFTLAQSEQKKAEPDTFVTAEPAALEGFTFDETNEDNVLTGTASETLVLKLYYTRNSYTLTWDVGEGSITSADDAYTHGTVKYGTPITYPDAVLTGCTVAWSQTLVTMPAADTTVTATWKVALYPVNWNANGGSINVEDSWGTTTVYPLLTWDASSGSSCGAIYGQTFGKYRWSENSTSYSSRSLPKPTHSNKVFGGWYTLAEGGEEITADTVVTVPADGSFTFYAHWDDAYTVTLDSGTGSETTILVGQGKTFGSASEVPTPTKTGYTFGGWYDAEGNLLTLETVIRGDITFTAKWTPNTYKVTFYPNGGTGTMEPQTFTYGVAQKISKNLFTREGYRFVGWATWSSATTASYEDEQEYTIASYNQSFYAIWEEVRYDLTLNVTPADATVVVKNASGVVQAGTNGVYNLREGTYTYSVSKYGYETAEDTIELTKNETLNINLVKLPSYLVTFELTKPEGTGDAVITVTMKDGTVMTAGENGAYDLIPGEYSYLIKSNGCNKVAADFTVVDQPITFRIELTLRTAWDGETKAEPHVLTAEEAVDDYAGMEGWYLITNGDELAWIASKVNTVSGWTGNVVLARGIDLGNEKWSPIGTGYSYNFTGIFDGMGHTITGLYCEGSSNNALFGYNKGTVRNLIVRGEVSGASTDTAGIVAYQSGGSLINLGSYVTVNGNNKSGGRVGGVAGYVSNATVESCFNAGALTGGLYQGGVVAYAGGTTSLTNCYNVGTTGKGAFTENSYSGDVGNAGGVLGYCSGSAITLTNCYNAGALTAGYTNTGALVGGISSYSGNVTLNNCYYLNVVENAVGGGTASVCEATAKTADELKSAAVLELLGTAYKADGLYDSSINNGYPVLDWQVLPAHVHTMSKTEAKDATCTEPGNTAYWTCSVCGKLFSDEKGENETTLEATVIPATGHSLEKTEAKDATCTEAGNTAYWTCSVCGRIFSDEKGKHETTLEATVIPAKGHSLEKAEAKDATCTEDGNTAYWTCSVCGKLFSDEKGETETTLEATVIPATGHSLEKAEAKDASCTEAGNTAYWTCSVCGRIFSDEKGKHETTLEATVIPAKGHDWGEWVVTIRPTCTAEGKQERTCSACGETETEVLPKIACPSANMTDVPETAWYHDAVDYMMAKSLMGGVSATTFDPEGTLTRAQLVTVLYRIEGEPEVDGKHQFTDVPAGQWYSDAICWAAQNGIVNGVSKTEFAPEEPVTREQIAAILYRYTKSEPVKENKFSAFPDAGRVSPYAVEALNWAVAEGLINGSDGKLLPNDTATRAQIATVLMRFLEK